MCDCGGAIEKEDVVRSIACPVCRFYAWTSTMCPKPDALGAWHHPACAVVRTPHVHVGDFWDVVTHPWDDITSAWDAVKTIPGIGTLAQWGEDFANTAVGKAFFAFVSPSILAGMLSNAPAVGQALTVVMSNPVVYNALPGLARGERVDHAFIASAKMVAQRYLSSGAGQQAAADAFAQAGPVADRALAAIGTSPQAIEASDTVARVQAGLREAKEDLPAQAQALVDAQKSALLAKLPSVHDLAQAAGVPDDVMQVVLDGKLRMTKYDASKYDAQGRLPVNANANALSANVIGDLDANFTAQALKPLLQWRAVLASETPREIAQYLRAHPDLIMYPGHMVPTYVASMVPRAKAAVLDVSEDQATQNITQALLRSGMHPVVRVAQGSSLAALASNLLGTPAPAAPPPVAAPVPVASPSPGHALERDEWFAFYLAKVAAAATLLVVLFFGALGCSKPARAVEGVVTTVASDTCRELEQQPEPEWVDLVCAVEAVGAAVEDAAHPAEARVRVRRSQWRTIRDAGAVGLIPPTPDRSIAPMLIQVLNRSTVVPPDAFAVIVPALHVQASSHFAGAHGLRSDIRLFGGEIPRTGSKPAMRLEFIDEDPSSPDELGDHYVDKDGVPVGRVLCKTALQSGTGRLFDDVPPVASHELLEMLGDPLAGMWFDNGEGGLIAGEVSDPVQGDTYAIGHCKVSNFVLPTYFNPALHGKGVKTNWMGAELEPCEIAPNGYALIITNQGDPNPVFGDKVPHAKKVKALRGRLGRRIERRWHGAAERLIARLEHEHARATANHGK